MPDNNPETLLFTETAGGDVGKSIEPLATNVFYIRTCKGRVKPSEVYQVKSRHSSAGYDPKRFATASYKNSHCTVVVWSNLLW